MPEQTPQTTSSSRSFAIGIGVTESIYLLGLLLLAIGIALKFDLPTALIGVGALLVGTAFHNAAERAKGTL